jgi:hypothetical protein
MLLDMSALYGYCIIGKLALHTLGSPHGERTWMIGSVSPLPIAMP